MRVFIYSLFMKKYKIKNEFFLRYLKTNKQTTTKKYYFLIFFFFLFSAIQKKQVKNTKQFFLCYWVKSWFCYSKK
jgi:hypothetical protein